MKNEYTKIENLPNDEDDTFSEVLVVKREILESFYCATKTLGYIYKVETLGRRSAGNESEFKMYCFNLYLKIKPFFNDKKLKVMESKIKLMEEVINDSIYYKQNIPFNQWKHFFMIMTDVLRKLKIYGVGVQKGDATEAWSEGKHEA